MLVQVLNDLSFNRTDCFEILRIDWDFSRKRIPSNEINPSESEEKERALTISPVYQPFAKGQDKLVYPVAKRSGRSSFSQQAFFAAVERYIRSYVYLCHTGNRNLDGWDTEILLSGEKGDWQTVALAGTQSLRRKLPAGTINWRTAISPLYAASCPWVLLEEKGLVSPGRRGFPFESDFFFSLPIEAG